MATTEAAVHLVFWAMHDATFAHRQGGTGALDDAQLSRYAEAVGAAVERPAAGTVGTQR